ncbi:hypothetical protein [Vitiosangium sp. GDMCC 1.1324]|uniref:hypothetical protein n=1 Tax=Vitiosangium sp. (strain GDMCC 1.1324) TaxID=2138576 RepID=UPI000D36F2EF|nr:hypothetical protein [Vitiosangium sp. GDMCC 1.1324]PTL76044.1 hypothetical protein DAT35_51925 [Vitiosangium sp. GDMCC 1.1324]
MPLSPLSVSLLLLHAVSLSPASVPARGNQETLVTLDRASRVVISARTPAGTSCEIVDQVRGPFAQSGAAGRANCELDLLLDAGTYKLRLASTTKGKGTKGKVDLKAVAYTEDNAQLVLLEPGREVRQLLAPHHQASFWLKLDQRQPVTVRVSGRTAGDVRLWRNGSWLEPVEVKDASTQPRGGQPQYEWWLETTLDPGNYLLTTYGTAPKAWTEGQEDNTLSVAYGFPKAPAGRSLSVTLPPWGLSSVELPSGPTALFLSREGSQATSRVSVHALSNDGASNVTSGAEAGCQIQNKALVPECSTTVGGSGRHVALLRGEPGARLTLQWARLETDDTFVDGSYGSGSVTPRFDAPATGEYLVGLHEVPLDPDSTPLGCMLESWLPNGNWAPVTFDAPEVGPDRPFRRAFNYDGSNATVWFRVTRSGRYVFSTSGERKGRCELYQVDGSKRIRLIETDPKAEACRVAYTASPGVYELKLYGGTEGIERLTLAAEGKEPKEDTATRTSCLMRGVKLQKGGTYHLVANRSTGSSMRGLVLRPMPLTLSEPLPVVLDGPGPLELPLAQGGAAEVRSSGGEPFTCTVGGNRVEARDGRCQLPSTGGTLSLSQAGGASINLLVHRPAPPAPPPPPLSAYSPTFPPLPSLQPSEPAWFDFERGQSHSLTFDVKKEGLYHVTTQGLLATECSIRTPVVPQVGSANGGGRGRNCLVSTYLRPGRYLLTARTTGQSKGRGAVLLERRDVKTAEGVIADGEAFFRVDAGDLIQQRLTVPRTTDYTLSSTALGARLQCRLDDAKGWPVVTVPTACQQTLRLGKGNYLWTQLPLTVESMRRTALERVEPPVVLKGNKVHPVLFNKWYRADLGKDGKDEFSFEVPAVMKVAFTLTHGMQGRLYSVGTDGALKPVEVIAPQTPATPPPPPPEPEPEQERESSEYSEGGEGSGEESSESRGEEESPAPSQEESEPTAIAEPLPAEDAPPPEGQSLTLEPGRYKLVAEHSRGDVAISYALYLRTEVLAPPMVKDVSVPGRIPLLLPEDGTLRLFTRGSTDVRCRLFDGSGRLVVESSDHGADWNCAIAEPLPKGDYTLVLESQTQQPGASRVSVELAQVSDAGVLAEGGTLEVGTGVVRATLPPVPADALQQVSLRAKAPFSCALEDERGAVVSRKMDVRECVMLLKPGPSPWRVRVWTLGQPTKVSTGVAARPLRPSGGKIPAGEALSAQVPRPGRYETGRGVYCLPASQQGPLRPCGPEASLEAGDWVFGVPGATAETKLSLSERVDTLEKPLEERASLSRDVTLLRQRSKRDALHLLRVNVPFGDPAYPACRLDGGVSQQRSSACFAATGPTEESLARWWTPGEGKGEATLERLAIPVPTSSVPLTPGLQDLTWSGGPGLRLVMPGEPVRVQLSLPQGAWAVLVDGKGAAVDLCSPGTTLSRCVLSGTGGAVFVWSPAESRIQTEVLAVEAAKPATSLAALFEATPRVPGQQLLSFGASNGPRELKVTGAERCVASLDDGTRLEGCELQVPPGHSGNLLLETNPGGVRAVLAPPAELATALLPPVSKGKVTDLPAAKALRLSGETMERALTLPSDAVVHIRSDSGVCGLTRDTTVLAVAGLERGCAFDRLLEAGTYRLLVRGFAGQPLSGSITWTHEPVKELTEGVAKEEGWVPPGQTRYFRFTTASAGHVGLGLQVPAELLQCTVLDTTQRVLGEGCQQFLALEKGTYLLAIHAPSTLERPLPFKPVLVGLAGTKTEVPEEFLRDFFNRIGANP